MTEMQKKVDEMTMKVCRVHVNFSICPSDTYGALGFDVDAPSEMA